MHAAAIGLILLVSACGGGSAPPRVEGTGANGVVSQDFTVDGRDDGVTLFIRNKHSAEWTPPRPDRTILFLHGATFPGEASFDLAVDGASWMDWLARRGYDVYMLDVRGYGKSSRPTDNGQPAADTEQALRDVSKAVDFVLSRSGQPRLVLVGWSWGATLAGLQAQAAGNQVERLVLLAPQWLREGASGDPTALGAWRKVRLDQARQHWEKGAAGMVSPATLSAWVEALKQGDPEGAKEDPPSLRVPSGAAADVLRFWAKGQPQWQPEKVWVPTLVVQGDRDTDWPPEMGLGVFARLEHAPAKRYVLIGGGTHMMMLEKSREQLFRAVQAFLEERF